MKKFIIAALLGLFLSQDVFAQVNPPPPPNPPAPVIPIAPGSVATGCVANSILRTNATNLTTCDANVSYQTAAGGPLNVGNLPWVVAFNYVAGSTGARYLGVRGTLATPNTDNVATAIYQAVCNSTTGTGCTTEYVSMNKLGSTAGIDNRAIWGECVDNGGGGSLSCGRFNSNCIAGTGGNCTGSTNVGLCNVSFAFCVGAEQQAWNLFADATTTFSALSFSTPSLSSCAGLGSGGKKCSAGFLLNPNATLPDIYGFLAPSGTIDATTGVVVASLGTSNYGVDFNSATFASFAWRGPGATSTIDGSGNIISSAVIRANAGFSTNGTPGLASKSCLINTANAATGVTLTITGGLITGTTTC